MKDLAREKYALLMAEIENLEDCISEFENENPVDYSQLEKAKAQLADKKSELARISDGCGRPHPMS
ncbi:MAG: hypothetical protein WC765_01270 [Phycisphaerae bacterium]|jgi:hypothetical protein|nr:hypothetical protein [Phycisphaerales bacterium]HBR20746.1 hypothetical protein [Phycisphaerales bacterium]